ncbi:unnamed protein product [Adineta steineri]|uniref:DUF389 domain-containing protein n=1 Tax=Adineta steineri TaxID=433720 RepID=A0A819PUW4_9BILA|nr:unnamed protein product [Adineta steineri]CAF0736210.1 unnamed protein product [Adineta steineri]CAF3891819.1 unnamed protein product [Adineta steineri]CAF4021124.1 unnamed protein product [Adineta steineri]
MPKLKLRDTIWIPTNNNKNFFIVCYTDIGPQSDGILDELRRAEIGIRAGSKVFIIPLTCALGIRKVVDKQKTLPSVSMDITGADRVTNAVEDNLPVATPLSRINRSWYQFFKTIRARMNVHKIIGLIRYQSSLTFDYLFFCVLASLIAGLGLLENNTVILVASMLVSPLMGPIMGFVIGIRVLDKKLWLSGIKSECTGIVVAVLTGFLFGLCTTWSETKWGSSASFPTDEMRSRGDYRRLWFGALVALPSGAAAALSILGGNFGSLVGVAISASLLPPAVNTGLLFSYSLLSVAQPDIGRHSLEQINRTVTNIFPSTFVNCTAFVNNDYLPLYSCDMPKEAAQLGIFSFIITFINIMCICIMALIVLLIKRVVPIIPDNEITQLWRLEKKSAGAAFNNKVYVELDNENAQELEQISNDFGHVNGILQQYKDHIV